MAAPIMKLIRRLACAVALIALVYLCVLAFPQPLFGHRMTYQNYEIWSDRPIPPQITQVLDDATRRLRTSELYDQSTPIRIFFCYVPWRLWLYSQQFSDKIGGNADSWLTRNIYIRASDIAANRIYSPGPEPILDADKRPLSYFIAHEATHIIESRQFGRLMYIRYPKWLTEGYADYVGKGGDFNFDDNRKLLVEGNPLLVEYHKIGLYRRFHLEVFYLLDKKGMTAKQLFANPPQEDKLLEILKGTSSM